MNKQFTASKVRDIAWSLDGVSRQMLRAFADMLEAREKAVPVAYAEFAYNGCVRMWSRGYEERLPGTRMIPLYTHPRPPDADRLAEALREQAAKWVGSMYFGMSDENEQAVLKACANDVNKILAAHSAQAQPPAASVPEVTGLTWEPPNVTVDVERVGRFRSGDEHIVRVTFRSSDDGRRMTCFYAANESAVGYLHAMLAAQENPNG